MSLGPVRLLAVSDADASSDVEQREPKAVLERQLSSNIIVFIGDVPDRGLRIDPAWSMMLEMYASEGTI